MVISTAPTTSRKCGSKEIEWLNFEQKPYLCLTCRKELFKNCLATHVKNITVVNTTKVSDTYSDLLCKTQSHMIKMPRARFMHTTSPTVLEL